MAPDRLVGPLTRQTPPAGQTNHHPLSANAAPQPPTQPSHITVNVGVTQSNKLTSQV